MKVIKRELNSSSWEGSALPAYPVEQPEITELRVLMDPGEKTELHKHGVISFGVVIVGELTLMTPGGDKKVFRAGDSIVEVVDVWHTGLNSGETPTEIWAFFLGAKGLPIVSERAEG